MPFLDVDSWRRLPVAEGLARYSELRNAGNLNERFSKLGSFDSIEVRFIGATLRAFQGVEEDVRVDDWTS